jgi:hypothetical protein
MAHIMGFIRLRSDWMSMNVSPSKNKSPSGLGEVPEIQGFPGDKETLNRRNIPWKWSCVKFERGTMGGMRGLSGD